MPDATLGGLFGGLAQGAEAGMRLNVQQQQLGLQQQNMQRMQEIEKRQTAMQFYSTFVNTLQLDPNERGPALDKLEETAQGMGVPVDPAMFEHARKLTRDQSDALIQTINAAVPGMSTDALMNLPKNYLGTMLPLLIQSRYRQQLQESLGNLGQPGTTQGTPQGPAIAPGSTISPQAPTQVSPQGAQGQPASELDQLRAVYAANDQKLSLLSQYGTVVPEAKEMATVLNSQQQRIQQRIQHLEGGTQQAIIQTPQGPMHVQFSPGGGMRLMGPAPTPAANQVADQIDRDILDKTGLRRGDKGYANEFLNRSKILALAPGGELRGSGELNTPGAQSGPEATTKGPLASRPITLSPQEVGAVADDRMLIDALKDLKTRAESIPDSALMRGSLGLRGLVEKGTPFSALTKEEREYLSRFQALRILYDRALTNGSSIFRSFNLINMMQAVMGQPTAAGAGDRIGTVLDLAESKLNETQKAIEQSGRTPMGRQPAKPAGPRTAEDYLKSLRK